jgi:hypothetical protein
VAREEILDTAARGRRTVRRPARERADWPGTRAATQINSGGSFGRRHYGRSRRIQSIRVCETP